ncbi:MAG TPA: DNA polymerase III subunit alpha [Phycisphaerales bacterium]|nr:DNA polymerase III subunit alpha [Phycisphaerales bacterium]
MASMTYVPLWCKSNYSFLEGASHPEELISQAVFAQLPAVAITDRHGVYGLVRAYQRAKELDFQSKLICGAQLTVQQEESPTSLMLLVQNKAGWKNLCRLLTVGARRSEKGENIVNLEEVQDHNRGLIALWGGEESSLYCDHDNLWKKEGELLTQAFGNRLYAVIARHKLFSEKRTEPRALIRAHRLGILPVAAREVLYHRPSRRRLQDVVTCIRHGVPLEQAGRLLKPNSNFHLLGKEEFEALYCDLPEAVKRTREVADRCEFQLSDLRYRYPDEPLPQGLSSAQWLRELAFTGAQKRYPEGVPDSVVHQLEKELTLITKLDYVGYFLTMYEIVRYCRENEILCQGRGSAANSVVCFCLGITAVDPIKLGLLFERFISEERAEPPDIDLDITHQRREEVIKWVYERYGREKAAMVCNVVRYRPRSAVREIGKVLQVEVPVIERLARLLTGFSSDMEEQVLEGAGIPTDSPFYRTMIELVNEILDFPRHLSIHPGGFLLGADPVCELVPIENATMDGRTVIQWDKYDVEELGLFKVDLLGLGALSHLHRGFELLSNHRGLHLSMATLPVDDPATFAMLSTGDSVGIFQIESRAQMAMLPSMQPRCFYDLVIQVAIVRPGPITGGMVNPYLRRRSGEEEIEYPHPSLVPVLEKTLGVPLFQEQVMKLAVVAADYTPGEADQLRRDMAAWNSHGKIERHRERLTARMIAKGIEPEFAERVFAQIKGFGEYGFPESHAASFALITYATSYLRCHYPAEFTCSLLNSLPMGFYSASTLLEDARRKKVSILSFCAEKSQWECTLEPLEGAVPDRPFGIRLGLKFLKGFREDTASRILQNRPYRSVRDLTVRARLDKKALELLASSGALDCYGRNRRTELWATDSHLEARRHPLLSHLEEVGRDFHQLSRNEKVVWDYETAGMSATGHPMESLRPQLSRCGYPDAATVQRTPHGRWIKYAAMVICRQRPATAKGTVFFTLEDETGFVNVIVWPKVFEEHFVVARSTSFLAVEGQIQNARGVVHLVAQKLYRPDLEATVEVGSRNFH